MSSSYKVYFSLFVTFLIFGFCSLAGLAGGFDYLENNVLKGRYVKNLNTKLTKVANIYDEYIDNISLELASYVLEPSIKTFVSRSPTDADMVERQNKTFSLFEKLQGLDGIRIVDKNGTDVHYSTFQEDIFLETDDLISFRDYSEETEHISIADIALSDTGNSVQTLNAMLTLKKIYFDSINNRLIFSFPYFDTYQAFRGSAIFYIPAEDFFYKLHSENIVNTSSNLDIINSKNSRLSNEMGGVTGFVLGAPSIGKVLFEEEIIRQWSRSNYNFVPLVHAENKNDTYILLSSKASRYCTIGLITLESDFLLDEREKILLLAIFFISIFLFTFMLVNLKTDDMTVIRSTVSRFELGIFRQYLEKRDSLDWGALKKRFTDQKQDINARIIKELGRRGRKYERDINEMLNICWAEFMAAMSSSAPEAAPQQSAPQETLPQVAPLPVENTKEEANIPPSPVATQSMALQEEQIEELEELDELEDVEELEVLEDLEELEEVEAVEDIEKPVIAPPIENTIAV